jgi:hypothetical protein
VPVKFGGSQFVFTYHHKISLFIEFLPFHSHLIMFAEERERLKKELEEPCYANKLSSTCNCNSLFGLKLERGSEKISIT